MITTFSFFKKLVTHPKVRFLIGFLVVLILQIWSTYQGEGTAKTHDSLQYLKTAENLVLYSDFIQKEAQPYIAWALGFPFLLIVFEDSIFLNLICILGSYVFYVDLIEKLFQKILTKWWLILAFASATSLYLIHHFVWSEPPFLLFLVGTIWAFYYFSYSKSNQKLIWFCLFGFLFCAMRNAGLYFVIAINSGIILFYILPHLLKNEANKIKLLYQNLYFKSLVYFSFFSVLPIFLWWMHAKIKTQGIFDTIYDLALRTFTEECLNYGDILSRWLFPPSIALEIRIFLLLFFVFILSLLGTRAMVSYFSQKNHCSCSQEQLTKQNSKFILFIFWITFVYLVGMLLSRAGMKIDAERFLAIIYPFLCILIGFILDKMKGNNFLKNGIAFLWLIYPFLRTLKNIIFWNGINSNEF